jgi:hypothetical protein
MKCRHNEINLKSVYEGRYDKRMTKGWKKYESRDNNVCRFAEGGCWRRVKATVYLPSALNHYEWLQAARMC